MRMGLPGASALMLMVVVMSVLVSPPTLPRCWWDPYWTPGFTTRLVNLGSTNLGNLIDKFVGRDALVRLLAGLLSH